jgi:hypothetical protein
MISTDTIVGAMVGMSVDRVQTALQTSMAREQIRVDQEAVERLSNTRSASTSGTGLMVDKTA